MKRRSKQPPQKKIKEVNWIRPKYLSGNVTVRKAVEPKPVRRDEGIVYKSADSGRMNTAKPEKKEYTGTLIKGISTMHKSNAVPVISQEEATDIAQMRRN